MKIGTSFACRAFGPAVFHPRLKPGMKGATLNLSRAFLRLFSYKVTSRRDKAAHQAKTDIGKQDEMG
jgi:hypothetical protein